MTDETEDSDPKLPPKRVNLIVINGNPTEPVAEKHDNDGTSDSTRWAKVRKQLDAVNLNEETTCMDALGVRPERSQKSGSLMKFHILQPLVRKEMPPRSDH